MKRPPFFYKKVAVKMVDNHLNYLFEKEDYLKFEDTLTEDERVRISSIIDEICDKFFGYLRSIE